MAPVNTVLVFGSIVTGGVLVKYGVASAKTGLASIQSAGGGASSTGALQTIGGFPKSVDPLPGATAGRADQGVDGTGKTFLSPWDGKVVFASASDPGWKGGGYVAVQSTQDPSKVYYVAEGITPIVHVGQMVSAGARIATPRPNPFNGTFGNFEAGLANPHSPGQPLAQVIGDPRGMVLDFIKWITGLGLPQPTSEALAGHP